MVSTSRYPVSTFPTLAGTITRKTFAAFTALLFTVTCMAQDTAQPPSPHDPQSSTQPQRQSSIGTVSVTLPVGTKIPLVLTHDIRSKSMHRGDPIYAQVSAPVDSGNQMVIPPGTFVQGTVARLQQKRGRAELHLQSMAITFPDGSVAPVSGPLTLESDEGYALKDPGAGRTIGFVALPAAGAGLGALIGHSLASPQSSTITSSLPPGCTGPPPGCLSSSLSVPPNKGESTVIGSAVGGAIGLVASLTLVATSNNFFLNVGTPVNMVLQQPLSLPEPQAANAVQESIQQPVAVQPIAKRPSPPPPSVSDHGTCYTPDTPGTPDTVIPGAPGPDGVPGPSTTIPGIPATPGTPYPCP